MGVLALDAKELAKLAHPAALFDQHMDGAQLQLSAQGGLVDRRRKSEQLGRSAGDRSPAGSRGQKILGPAPQLTIAIEDPQELDQ
ncbi:MAG TPA: hypothetical protein VF524_02655, partial [Polyangia bacterium]